jgi:hypothetical protein
MLEAQLLNLKRYFYTLIYLKPRQLWYQFWYRLRNRLCKVEYKPLGIPAKFQRLKFIPFPDQYTHYHGDGIFEFLNKPHSFDGDIDWNFSGNGKLWTYHLNYFDFLHQAGFDWGKGSYLINDFLDKIESNHDGLEPYPNSLRAINWIKFLAIHDTWPQEMVDSLYAQYNLLLRNLEYHILGNHLLENGFSLLFGAVFFEDSRLENTARSVLGAELEEQFLEDGAHFELSPMYHLIVLQRALDSYNLLVCNQHSLDDIQQLLASKIQKMVNWLQQMMFSNGDYPMFNDSTPGQALAATTIIDYATSLGFVPTDWKLSDSGYRKFRNGLFETIADVGEIGPHYQPGHANCDMLSFVMYYNSVPIIVDRGISTYEKNVLRQEERGTASHNTVMINDTEQSDVWGGFRVGRRAKPRLIQESPIGLIASHTGYEHIAASHSREWTFNEDGIIIEDKTEGKYDNAKAFFHFHPEVSVLQTSESSYSLGALSIRFTGELSVEVHSYNYAAGFNKHKKALKLIVYFSRFLRTAIKENH